MTSIICRRLVKGIQKKVQDNTLKRKDQEHFFISCAEKKGFWYNNILYIFI